MCVCVRLGGYVLLWWWHGWQMAKQDTYTQTFLKKGQTTPSKNLLPPPLLSCPKQCHSSYIKRSRLPSTSMRLVRLEFWS